MFLPQANAEVLCLDPAAHTGHLGACWFLLYFVLPSTKAETSRQVLMSLPEAPKGERFSRPDRQCWDPQCLPAHGNSSSAPLTHTVSQLHRGWDEAGISGKKVKAEGTSGAPIFCLL